MLLLNDKTIRSSYFTTFPFETLRYLVKCERLSRLLFDMAIKWVRGGSNAVQLKALYLIAIKWQNLRVIYKNYVSQSPALT
jgi:hypothetical protein